MQVSRGRTFLSISIIIILVILFHYLGWLSPIENLVRRVINPGSKIIYDLGIDINNQHEQFANSTDLMKAYKELKEKFVNIQVELSHQTVLQNDNEELRQQLNYLKTKNYNYLGAEVIGKNIDPMASTLIIDRGQRDGVQEGQPVLAGAGVMVGRIVKVEQNQSLVRLLNDNQSKIAAALLNSEKSIGIVEGGYGISIKMDFIPQTEVINVNDQIITSGLQTGVPRGLLLGTTEAVEKELYQPFQQAILTPLIDLNKISLVEIILGQK